jgi:hypothetical protein
MPMIMLRNEFKGLGPAAFGLGPQAQTTLPERSKSRNNDCFKSVGVLFTFPVNPSGP